MKGVEKLYTIVLYNFIDSLIGHLSFLVSIELLKKNKLFEIRVH